MTSGEHTQPRATAKRRRRHGTSLLLAFGTAVLVAYALGFTFFVANLPSPRGSAAAKADAIVALTGGGGRLAPAVTLLENGNGKRLLITGVNKLISKHALKTLLHGGAAFDCCADLGFAAQDTRGNAAEAAVWAREHRYGSLIVVTANYHMPRSLVEFGAAMPDVRLVPYPVSADPVTALSWDNARRLHGEYVKYLASMVRVSAAGAFPHA
jgi:uncharacterized SAM-binding protein YcdF (DUF218 family)